VLRTGRGDQPPIRGREVGRGHGRWSGRGRIEGGRGQEKGCSTKRQEKSSAVKK